MATKMYIEDRFPCSAQALFDLLSNPEFDDKLMQAIEMGKTILSTEETPDGRRIRQIMRPNTELPGFMAKVAGKTNEYTEVRLWQRSKLGNTWTIEPSFKAGKIDIHGTLSIRSAGDHECLRVVEGSFSVGVPLLGGKIEKFIIESTEQSFRKNTAFVKKYVQDHGIK